MFFDKNKSNNININDDFGNDDIKLKEIALDDLINNVIEDNDSLVKDKFELIDDNLKLTKVNLEDIVENVNEKFNYEFKQLNEIPDLNLEGFNEIELSIKFKKNNEKNCVENKHCCKENDKEVNMSCCYLHDNDEKECKCLEESNKKENDVFVEEIKPEADKEVDLNKLENIKLLDSLDSDSFDDATVDNEYLYQFTFEEETPVSQEKEEIKFNSEFLRDESIFNEVNEPIETPSNDLELTIQEIANDDNELSYDVEINEPTFNDDLYLDDELECCFHEACENCSCDNKEEFESNNIAFNEISSMDSIALKSHEYKKNLLNNKKEIIVDSDEQVVFDDINSFIYEDTNLNTINDENKQVIFDETETQSTTFFDNDGVPSGVIHESTKQMDDIVVTLEDLEPFNELENVVLDETLENKDLTEAIIVDQKEDEEEIIKFEVPSFETFDIASLENETNQMDNSFEFVNFDADKKQEEEIDLDFIDSQFPSINVDDEISSLIDIEDIEVIKPNTDLVLNELKLEDIQIEYLPETSDNLILLDDELISSEKLFSDYVSEDEYKDVPVINTYDEVIPLDYSSYTISNYVQPEIIKIEEKNNLEYDYSNIEVVEQGEIPSWYVQPIDPSFEHNIDLENNFEDSKPVLEQIINYENYAQSSSSSVEKELIVRNDTFPTIEEQIKKMKKPNLFRRHTVAAAANMVILKSIDRLLNMTNSVLEKQAIKKNN